MTRKKTFPKVDLHAPKVGRIHGRAEPANAGHEPVPPKNTQILFPAARNPSGRRTFDFATWYGRGIDNITLGCQRQIERFVSTHDGDRATTTLVDYCASGLREFLDYLLVVRASKGRTLTLADIDRDLIDGFLVSLDGRKLTISAKRSKYTHTKPVLLAMGQRGLFRLVEAGDQATFPRDPFPLINLLPKGEAPLPKAQRRAFTAAIKTAVMPLFGADAEPTSELLSYAVLIIALHTGRNTTPLLEMTTDCLRPHPKDGVELLVVHKRRGNNSSKVPVRSEPEQSTPAVTAGVVRLIHRVIELTAPFREQAPLDLKSRLWIFRSQSHQNAGRVSNLTPSALAIAAKRLIVDAKLEDAHGQPLRVNVSRLRKTFVNRINELLDGDLVATAVAAGNTPRVTGTHYLRPGEGAQRNWLFMGRALTRELLTASLGATKKTPVGRCTDNKHGQFAPKRDGATCMSFLDCLRCRNYVVTGDDLYRLFSYYWRIYDERGRIGKVKWDRHYAHIVRLIDRDVIDAGISRKVFKPEAVDAARERARVDPHPYWKTAGIMEALQ